VTVVVVWCQSLSLYVYRSKYGGDSRELNYAIG